MSKGPSDERCPICTEPIPTLKATQIKEKGAKGINAASNKRGKNLLVAPGDWVHEKCRQNWINHKAIENAVKGSTDSDGAVRRRSRDISGQFDNKVNCLFCSQVVTDKTKASEVMTHGFAKTISAICESRSDDWSHQVKGRLEYFANDLPAAECVYHHLCSSNFRIGQGIPKKFDTEPATKRRKAGRPADNDQEQAFLMTCSVLENDDEEQFTIASLANEMAKFLTKSNSVPYGNHYLKQKLKAKYGDSIYIAESDGIHDIVTMREKTHDILRSHFSNAKDSDDDETKKKAIIQTAARLLKSEIKSGISQALDKYPEPSDLKLTKSMEYIPDSLKLLFDLLFVGKDTQRKVAALGQAVIQAVRPRLVIAPLQIGLATQIHHVYRSRFLVDSLNAMGFCSSYSEVSRFEDNAADIRAEDVLGGPYDLLDISLQFSADNFDHNIRTLDGNGTFHGMGMVATLTPGRMLKLTVPRKKIAGQYAAEATKIDILDYRFSVFACRSVNFVEIPSMPDIIQRVDLLWEMSVNFKQPVPNWQGMMSILHKNDNHPGQSSVYFLPMIDMYSGDMNCIFSTLTYLNGLAYRYRVPTIVTFDQPLYWKASQIVQSLPNGHDLKDTIILLGSFHTFMNVLGAIGDVMAGPGLDTLLQEIYGENTVRQILSGKAVERAFRAHLLVDKCLTQDLLQKLFEDRPELSHQYDDLEKLYTSTSDANIDELLSSDSFTSLEQALTSKCTQVFAQSKTSQLWLSYQRMVSVARSLIRADRSGSWELHLQTISKCLPIFAAAGHFNYLKSAHFYLQQMCNLEVTHPIVHEQFSKGLSVVRRSDKYWAGLGSDLVIEQCLMRSLKTSGGLTRGSGMTEQQRAVWTMAAPISSQYHCAMQEFCGTEFVTSEQHKDCSNARLNRDAADVEKLSAKLQSHSPFDDDASLRNIFTGVIAGETINVHELESVGQSIVERMCREPVFSYSFKRKSKVRTLASRSEVKVNGEQTIDSALLFQRMLVISQTGDVSLDDVMGYELCPFPSSLFEDKGIFRKAGKPQLADAIYNHIETERPDTIPITEHYVLDGGSLLHRIPWKNGDTYATIAMSYADFVAHKFGEATIVFDGYEEPSIKDNTHERRKKQSAIMNVHVSAEMQFKGKKEVFLSSSTNKMAIIKLISEQLRQNNCTVDQSRGDADVDIAQAAVVSSQTKSTTLIGEDTDLLVLSIYLKSKQPPGKKLYFRSDKTKGSTCKVYDISVITELLGSEASQALLFIHAFTGCDTVSRIHGVGKKTVFKKLMQRDSVLVESAKQFCKVGQTPETIENIGEKVLVRLLGGKPEQTLNILRCNGLKRKVVTASSFVAPHSLPQTSPAMKYHSQRTYLQVMIWMGVAMKAEDWGWILSDDKSVYKPRMTDEMPAPEKLLKIIHCNCTTGCNTNRCSCRKYGLPCSKACGPCQLTECSNLSELTDEEDCDENERN